MADGLPDGSGKPGYGFCGMLPDLQRTAGNEAQ